MLNKVWITAATVLALSGWDRPAEASFFMAISDGTVTVSCMNPPASCGPGWFTPSANTMAFTGTVGSYSVVLSSVVTNNPGNDIIAEMNNSNTTVARTTFASPSTLTILMSQDGFTTPLAVPSYLSSAGSATFSASVAGDSYSFESFVDSSDALFKAAPALGPSTTDSAPCSVISPGGLVSMSCASPFVAFTNAAPYSLTELMKFNILTSASAADSISATGGAGVTESLGILGTVPEPGSLSLLAIGAVGLVRRFAAGRRHH